jgi:hypothetical protein
VTDDLLGVATPVDHGAYPVADRNLGDPGGRFQDHPGDFGSRTERARRPALIAAGRDQGRRERNAGVMHANADLPGAQHRRRHVFKRKILIRHPVMATHRAHLALPLVVSCFVNGRRYTTRSARPSLDIEGMLPLRPRRRHHLWPVRTGGEARATQRDLAVDAPDPLDL